MVHVAMGLHLTARDFRALGRQGRTNTHVHTLVPPAAASSSAARFAARVTRRTTTKVSASFASCLSIMWLSRCVATIDVYASRPSALMPGVNSHGRRTERPAWSTRHAPSRPSESDAPVPARWRAPRGVHVRVRNGRRQRLHERRVGSRHRSKACHVPEWRATSPSGPLAITQICPDC